MALQPRRIFVDVQNRTFINSPNSNLPSSDPTWIDEDVESVEIYALKPTGDPAQPFEYLDLSGATIKFAVGSTTPAALQTSWTTLPTIVSHSISQIQAGGSFGGQLDEIQRVTWSGATISGGSYAIKFPLRSLTLTAPAGVTIFPCANHGLYDGQTITTTGSIPKKSFVVLNASQNSFSIASIGSLTALNRSEAGLTIGVDDAVTFETPQIVTRSIAYDAPISDVQQAVAEAGFVFNNIPQVLVSGQNGKQIQLYYAARNGQSGYPLVVIVNSSLSGAPGVSANVSYNTTEIAALIAAGTTAVTMEVEISEGAARQTFRQSATLSPDLISSTSPSPLPANVSTTFDLQSPDGSVFTFTVTNDGELSIAAIP
jgi:hypothetical protein